MLNWQIVWILLVTGVSNIEGIYFWTVRDRANIWNLLSLCP